MPALGESASTRPQEGERAAGVDQKTLRFFCKLFGVVTTIRCVRLRGNRHGSKEKMIRCVRLRRNRHGSQEELWVQDRICAIYRPHYPQYLVFTARRPCAGTANRSNRARFHSTEVGTGPLTKIKPVPACLRPGPWKRRRELLPQLSRVVGGCFFSLADSVLQIALMR
jgi:hypothetical protein